MVLAISREGSRHGRQFWKSRWDQDRRRSKVQEETDHSECFKCELGTNFYKSRDFISKSVFS